MKCKFCSAKLEENMIFCHQCGKAQGTPAKKPEIVVDEKPAKGKKMNKKLKITLSVIGLVLLALLLIGVVLHFLGKLDDFGRWLGFDIKTDIFEKSSYTADNEKLKAASDVVIATLGNQNLTNGEFQTHYRDSVNKYLQEVYYYGGDANFDPKKPFDQQIYDIETGKTYQQLFIEDAISTWKQYAILAQMADDAGFQYSAEQQASLDQVFAGVQAAATQNGYADVDAFVEANSVPGMTYANYVSYYGTSWKASCYFYQLTEEIMPNMEEIEAYYAAHEADFVQKKYSKDDGYYYNVRHILVGVEGEKTLDENAQYVYEQKQWDDCLEKAEKMLADFLANNPSESAFAELAAKNSADPGSASDGGLYQNLTKNYGFIKNFEDWYVDESRQVGDTGIVQNTESSVQGYHIMYFSGKEPIWEYESRIGALREKTETVLADAESRWQIAVRYDKILVSQMELTAS